MNTQPPTEDRPDDKLAQLLAKSGPRRAPPARLEAEVRAAVHAEWLHLTAAKNAKQRQRWLIAASVLFSALSVGWLARNLGTTAIEAPALIATITQLQGSNDVNNGSAQLNGEIHAGDRLRTDRNGGVRVELTNGINLRIAASSELRWLNANEAHLDHGAVYIDSHANAAALTVHTAHGDVRHLGTRYLINADQEILQVAVREGQVAIDTGSTQVTVNALQQVQVDARQNVLRSDLAMNDAVWQWADTLAEPFVLENRSVAEFLQWVSKETGYKVHYSSQAVSAAARNTLLHGQQTRMAPLQALQVVLAATDFRANVQDKVLVISQ